MEVYVGDAHRDQFTSGAIVGLSTCVRPLPLEHVTEMGQSLKTKPGSYRPDAISSVSFDIFAVRSNLSQLNGRPSMARLTVLKSTTEKTCR